MSIYYCKLLCLVVRVELSSEDDLSMDTDSEAMDVDQDTKGKSILSPFTVLSPFIL